MTHWFYAVLIEDSITWSRGIKARSEQAARAKLAALFPRAEIVAIER